MITQVPKKPTLHGVAGPVLVGKDVLELLSSAMYLDPLTIYREYVQNAADAIDEATISGLYTSKSEPLIEITVNPTERWAKIRDNGVGLGRCAFERTLTAIGGSKKRQKIARGFRGVGRLAGIGYCQQLLMRSKAAGESEVSILQWDCRRLKELLRDTTDDTLDEIISQIASIATEPANSTSSHFFEVELRNLMRYRNDVLLNETAISEYLQQVAPIPFLPDFSFAHEIEQHLGKFDAGQSYRILLNGVALFRPFRNEFEVRKKVISKFTDLELLHIPGVSADLDAIGWVLHSEYLGAIPERVGIQGFRVRSGNLQVGDARLLDQLFQEPRFNSWAVGEFHVLSRRLVPNARRDDFEPNTHYTNFISKLTPTAKAVAKLCRQRSAERARHKKQAAPDEASMWSQAKQFLVGHSKRKISKAHKDRLKALLRNNKSTYHDIVKVVINPMA